MTTNTIAQTNLADQGKAVVGIVISGMQLCEAVSSLERELEETNPELLKTPAFQQLFKNRDYYVFDKIEQQAALTAIIKLSPSL